MGKKTYIYTDIKQIHEINRFLEDADTVFNSSLDAFSDDKMKQYAKGNVSIGGKSMSPAMKGVIGGAAVGAGSAVITAGSAAGTLAGAGGIIGSGLVSSAVGGTAAAAGGFLAAPVLLVALPVALVGGVIIGGLFSNKKNREEKDRLREELKTYQNIAKKQNDYIEKYRRAVKKLQETVERCKAKLAEQKDLIEKLNNQIRQYDAILKKMTEYFNNLEKDLKEGGVLS